MEEISKFFLTEEEKDKFIDALTPELSLLRAKAEISQEEIANLIGISRQTYGSIERKARKMSWNTYLSLILFYDYNKKTHKMIRNISAFPHELIKRFNDGEEPVDFELNMLFKADTKNIIDSLDEQAISTIKTILMVEYSRCNNENRCCAANECEKYAEKPVNIVQKSAFSLTPEYSCKHGAK